MNREFSILAYLSHQATYMILLGGIMGKHNFMALAVATMIGSTIGADYMFPSRKPPANLDPSEVKQYVSLIWDDNAYSGLDGTPYEAQPGANWSQMGRVGGKPPVPNDTWTNTQNPLNIQEGDYGVSWAVRSLFKGKRNPDGSTPHQTFNVITGQMASVEGGWSENPTQFSQTGWKGESFQTVDWASLPTVKPRWSPVCWGREYEQNANGQAVQPDWAVQMYKEVVESGNEIGNHTIDHMESNSGLPEKYWPNSGEGFDNDPNEGEAYAPWETIGWLQNAGRKLSKNGWAGAIELGEAELTEHLDLAVSKGNLWGFRAPRLELNSNLFFALKEKGYLYDCGLEEGYEENVDGSNFMWPYTLDNGSQNVWTQRTFGSDVYIDSLPTGLWQLPANIVIVPEEIRGEVWENAKLIDAAAPDGGHIESKESFESHGKITGFDFNMFILWGMTTENWQKTMRANLDSRMSGNKAPFHYGCHTDYFSPMYDNSTLAQEANKDSYGLVVSKGWNNWKTRITAMESFVDYGINAGAYFVSGVELVEAMKELQKKESFGEAKAYNSSWEFVKNEKLNSSTTKEKCVGTIDDVTITVDAPSGSDYPNAGYASYEGKGFYTGLDHISLTYKATSALKVKLHVAGDEPWEVLLNNIGPEVNSGKIPLSAFHYNQYSAGTNESIDTKLIEGIEIQALTASGEKEDVTFSVKDITLYGASGISPILASKALLSKNIGTISMKSNALKLTVPETASYAVTVTTLNGQLVAHYKNYTLQAGANVLPLGSLTSGVYVVDIAGAGVRKVTKSVIR